MIIKQLAEANCDYCPAVSCGKPEIFHNPIQLQVIFMNLLTATEGTEYRVVHIETDDEELESFLFSLGCYSGEGITVVSRRRSGCTVAIKDGRYNIDNQLAEAIVVG
jgi:ferrous iron transport protein A